MTEENNMMQMLQSTMTNINTHIVNQGIVMDSLATQISYHGVGNSIETFDGKQDKYNDWIRALDKYSLLHNLSDERKINIALQTSRGVVSDYIIKWQRENIPLNRSWDYLHKQLTSRFSMVADCRHYKNLMRRTKQKTDESISVFSGRLQNLAIEAYGSQKLSDDLVQAELIECFIDGLHNTRIKYRLLERDPKDFDTAITIAQTQDNLSRMFALRMASPTAKNIDLSNNEEPMEEM